MLNAHWSVQTNHGSSLARAASPFPLTYKPQHIERERGMGLAGQTSTHLDGQVLRPVSEIDPSLVLVVQRKLGDIQLEMFKVAGETKLNVHIVNSSCDN